MDAGLVGDAERVGMCVCIFERVEKEGVPFNKLEFPVIEVFAIFHEIEVSSCLFKKVYDMFYSICLPSIFR